MEKVKVFCLSLLILLCLSIGITVAQGDVLRISPRDSTVLDKNTLERWTLEDFEHNKIKLLTGHEIEVNLIIYKEVQDIPDSYSLELRTDLENPEWNYEGTHYSGSPVIVWNSGFEHTRLNFKIILTAKVPASLIISDVMEPYFEDRLTGIDEKPHHIELTVYNRANLVSVVRRTEFFATSPQLVSIANEIKDGLTSANRAGVAYPEAGMIYELLEDGHPGWAYEIYKSLNVPSQQELTDVKTKIDGNIKTAHKNGVTYPKIETTILAVFNEGNINNALSLSEEYAEIQPPKNEGDRLKGYIFSVIIGFVVGGIIVLFYMKVYYNTMFKTIAEIARDRKRRGEIDSSTEREILENIPKNLREESENLYDERKAEK